jgi:hypothetical protein
MTALRGLIKDAAELIEENYQNHAINHETYKIFHNILFVMGSIITELEFQRNE